MPGVAPDRIVTGCPKVDSLEARQPLGLSPHPLRRKDVGWQRALWLLAILIYACQCGRTVPVLFGAAILALLQFSAIGSHE